MCLSAMCAVKRANRNVFYSQFGKALSALCSLKFPACAFNSILEKCENFKQRQSFFRSQKLKTIREKRNRFDRVISVLWKVVFVCFKLTSLAMC